MPKAAESRELVQGAVLRASVWPMDDHVIGRPAASMSAVPLDDGLSLFDAATGKAMALNRTASDIYALADGATTVEDAVAILAKAYDVEPAAITTEVHDVVDRLTAAGVLGPANQ